MSWIDFEGWNHGRVWKGKNGRLSFYIRRDGVDHATGESTVAGALTALERFEKTGDPRRPEDKAIILGTALAKEFLDHLKAKGDSIGWRRNVRQHLDWWSKQLKGRDLRGGRRRSVMLRDLRRALTGATSARQKEAVLRALYSYLRANDLPTAEDPLYGKPRIAPPPQPAQVTIDKTIDRDDLATVIGYLDEQWQEQVERASRDRTRQPRRWADLLRVLDGCGMHVSELERFAASGAIEPLPSHRPATDDEGGVLMCPLHKTGSPFRVAVSKATLEAAQRVRAAGPFSASVFFSELRKAAEKTGAKVLPGRFRHSIARYAVEHGATVAAVASFHQHKSAATTARYYAGLAVATKIPTPR